jgi:hypothetical protein
MRMKMFKDGFANVAQFSRLRTEDTQIITTAVVFDADYNQAVRIIPVSGSARVQAGTLTALTPTTTGGTIIGEGGITVFIPKGYYIGASDAIEVTPWG